MDKIDRVLVVEDLPEVAEWLVKQLAASLAPAYVACCGTFAAAREALLVGDYDLVLMDLGLPDGNGVDLIRLLREGDSRAVCIVTTIFDDAEHLFPALRAGADGYLLKDDDDTAFQQQLRGILDGRPPLSASIARTILQRFQPPRIDQTTVPLTPREQEILGLIARGFSVRHAAEHMSISHYTAAGYLKTVYQKLEVSNRAEATRKAMRLGLVDL